MKTKTILLLFSLLLTTWVYPGISKALAGEDSSKGEAVSIYSTPGLYPLAVKWAQEFNKTHPGQQIAVTQAEGATLSELSAKSGQFGFATGSDVAGMAATPGWEVVVGRDVIVPVINAANPFLAELRQKGVTRQAFTESISVAADGTWGKLLRTGSTDPIHYYIVSDPQAGALVSAFLGIPLDKMGMVKTVSKEELTAAVQKDPYAVGFCRLTDVISTGSTGLAENISFLPIDKNGNGKLDYMEQIYGDPQAFARGVWIGKYPSALTSDIFSVSSAQPADETVKAFLSWVLTDGQSLLSSGGYSELVINERQSQLDKVTNAHIVGTPAEKMTAYQKYLLIGLAGLIVIGFLLDRLGRRIRKSHATLHPGVQPAGPGGEFRTDEAPKGLYYDKTHTWVFMAQDGTVTAGIDGFLGRVTGPVTRIEMKKPGDKVSKGDPFVTIIQQGKKLVLYSPVSGTVKEQNRELAADASLLHSDPYSRGWIYRIEPANWLREIQFLSMAEKYREWLSAEITRLKDFLSIKLTGDNLQYAHVVLQDGGHLKENLLSAFGPDVWEDFQVKFLDSVK